MSRDINNLKEITNSILEDIQVTEDLKLSTLKRCKEQKRYSLKPFFVTAASVAVIILSTISYKFIFHKPDSSLTYNKETPNKSIKLDNSEDIKYSNNNKNNINNSINNKNNNSGETVLKKQNQQNNQSIAKDAGSSKSSNLPNNNNNNSAASDKNNSKNSAISPSSSENKLKISPSENTELNSNATTANIAEDTSQSASSTDPVASETPMLKSALTESSKSISIADAENFWGGKLLMPSYIPDGFELTDISLPKNDSKEIYVKLNYSFKNIYFKILQNKSTTSTSCTGKAIDINGSKGYVTKSKDSSNPSVLTTEINFVKNNVQYNITGNIQEDELVKIIKSMN